MIIVPCELSHKQKRPLVRGAFIEKSSHLRSFQADLSEQRKDISLSAYKKYYRAGNQPVQPTNINQTHIDISIARLSSYRSMFQGADDHEIYGIYCWNEALSANLFRLVSIIEVVLRNRFHTTLSLYQHNLRPIGRNDSNDWYNHITLPSKSAVKIRNETHRRRGRRIIELNPSPNDVVSRMTFGFWLKLLDADLPWEQLIPEIVPNHRYKTSVHWSTLRNQDALYSRIELVNKLRNRIAHFEPVWKQGNLKEERRPRQGAAAPRVEFNAPVSPSEAIQRLSLIHARSIELLKWLSQDRYNDYCSSYINSHFKWLCSQEGLDTYTQLRPGLSIPKSKFKREITSQLKLRNKISITCKGKAIGTYYPIIQ